MSEHRANEPQPGVARLPHATHAGDETRFDSAPSPAALHFSPLALPPSEPAARPLGSIAITILVNAAILSAAIVLTALVIRSNRSVLVTPVRPERTEPAPTLPRAPLASQPAAAAIPVHSPDTPPSVALGAVVAAPAALELPPPQRAKQTRSAKPLPAKAPSVVSAPPAPRVNPWALPQPRATKPLHLPFAPGRAQVIASMQRIAPAVYTCFDQGRGFAMVRFSVLGETGRVTSARVLGQTGRVSTCVANQVKRARLPQFQKKSLEITYPFKR